MARSRREALGAAVASVLAGSWRPYPAPADLDRETLAAVEPLLVRTKAAALAWRRVSSGRLADEPEALRLQRESFVQRVHAARLERDLEEVMGALRGDGVESIVLKGWAAARLYPQPGCRPYGDFDLLVRSAERARAGAILEGIGYGSLTDLDHEETRDLEPREIDRLFERSVAVPLGATRALVLSPEDHLGLVCHHAMRSYLWRPLWLCDVAVALEARGADFDWGLCLGGDSRAANWVAHTIGLASSLLGADGDGAPIPRDAMRPPMWLVQSVLDLWGAGLRTNHDPTTKSATSMRSLLTNPSTPLAALLERWPTPLEATIDAKRPIGRRAGRIRVLAGIAARGARFAVGLATRR